MYVNRYTSPAIALHWLIALLIFTAFPIGLIMPNMGFTPFALKLYSWHKWIGVTVFSLAIIRLLWRITHKPPPAQISHGEKILAHIAHFALYVLLFAIPLSGWLMSSAHGYQTVYLGIWPLPDLVAKNEALGKTLGEVHSTLNWILCGLVALHVLGALKHHIIDRNDVLTRMLPLWKRRH